MRDAGISGSGDTVAKLMSAPLDLRLWEDWRLMAEADELRWMADTPGCPDPRRFKDAASAFERAIAARGL